MARLYGTANQGGPNNAGTVFAIATDGTGFTVLSSLGGAEGGNPQSGLFRGLTAGFTERPLRMGPIL